MAPKFVPAVIAERRVLKGFTMKKLADRMGVSVATVSKWESGDMVPRPGKLDKLARLLGLKVEAMFQ